MGGQINSVQEGKEDSLRVSILPAYEFCQSNHVYQAAVD